MARHGLSPHCAGAPQQKRRLDMDKSFDSQEQTENKGAIAPTREEIERCINAFTRANKLAHERTKGSKLFVGQGDRRGKG